MSDKQKSVPQWPPTPEQAKHIAEQGRQYGSVTAYMRALVNDDMRRGKK